ncbi:MAG TPA: ABC transporter permease subunit [Cyclobacteriaceae bacterium]|nr:ABC transporter permease subunit [Cyclobacteriaceae bacterium]
MMRIAKYVMYDILRNRFVLVYTLFLVIVTLSLFSLDSDPGKAMLSVLNIVLLAVPLISIVFTTIHFFNSYEFMELLLAQPLNRKTIFLAEFLAVSGALCVAFLLGVGVPALVLNPSEVTLYLLGAGLLLTVVFVALAFGAAVSTRDKAKAIGFSLLFWFYFSLIYDGLILYVIYSFSDYPLEKVTLSLVSLNPVDLARIIILLKLDLSALMGYTGAFYKNFLGSNMGMLYAFTFLLLWAIAPLWLSLRRFGRKDI